MARSYVAEARRRVGPKRERIARIIERLLAEYPEATIALRFRNDLELLVSVMLSAQTTDVNVNRVTERLFRKYRTPRTTGRAGPRSSRTTSARRGSSARRPRRSAAR